MSRVIGFDFGTSNSSVAISMQCRPQIKLSRSREKFTPSVISVHDGRITVGGEGSWQKTGAVPDLKRIIGLSYDDKMIERYMKDSQVKLENSDGVVKLPVFREQEVKEKLKVEEFVSLLFREMTHTLQPIDRAVITVPASFGKNQRQAIRDAAAIAKFHEVELIEETTAAAVAFAMAKEAREDKNTTLTFQLGGGTIDVAIFSITKNTITVLGNACCSNLGGIDFDRNLLEYTLEKAGTIVDDAKRMVLLKSCKEVKEKLEKSNRAEIFHQAPNLSIQLSKEEFEIANQHLLSIIDIMLDMAMESARVKEVDEYFLIGRGCLIPYVEKNIAKKLGKHKRAYDVDVNEAAVMGAAIYAETESNIHVHDRRSGTISININEGKLSNGTEAEKLLFKSLPALQHINTKGLNMEIIVRPFHRNPDSCRGTTSPVLETETKRRKMDESIQKVSRLFNENDEILETQDRVERLFSKAANLLQDSENEIRRYEEVKLVSKDTVEWIKRHKGPFKNEELDERERRLSEKRRLIAKEDPPVRGWRRAFSCFIAIFWRIRIFLSYLFCRDHTVTSSSAEPKYDQMNEGVEDSKRVLEWTESQEKEKNEPVERSRPGDPTTSK